MGTPSLLFTRTLPGQPRSAAEWWPLVRPHSADRFQLTVIEFGPNTAAKFVEVFPSNGCIPALEGSRSMVAAGNLTTTPRLTWLGASRLPLALPLLSPPLNSLHLPRLQILLLATGRRGGLRGGGAYVRLPVGSGVVAATDDGDPTRAARCRHPVHTYFVEIATMAGICQQTCWGPPPSANFNARAVASAQAYCKLPTGVMLTGRPVFRTILTLIFAGRSFHEDNLANPYSCRGG
jgi:hypothetical protein